MGEHMFQLSHYHQHCKKKTSHTLLSFLFCSFFLSFFDADDGDNRNAYIYNFAPCYILVSTQIQLSICTYLEKL